MAISELEQPDTLGVASGTRSRRAAWVGGLLGWAAAASGVVSPITAFGVRPWHVLLILAALVAFGAVGRASALSFRLLPLDLVVGVYFFVTLAIELLNSSALRFEVEFVSVLSPLFYYIGYLSARAVVNQLGHAWSFLRTFIVPVLFVVPLAVGQSLGIQAVTQFVLTVAPGAGALLRLENAGLTRSTGLVGHWTGFGGYLIVVVAAAVAILAISHQLKEKRPKIAFWVLAAAGVCLVTTLTFSVVITAIVIILVCWNLTGFGTRFAVLVGGIGIVASVVFGSLIEVRLDQQFAEKGYGGIAWLPDWVPDTIQYRVRIWTEQTIPMIQERPATGWGNSLYEGVYAGQDPGRIYPDLLVWHSPESQWFGNAMTYGVTGLVIFLAMLGAIAVLLVRANRVPALRPVARPMVALFAMALVTATTVPIFTNRGFPMAFWPMVGIVVGLYLAAQAEDRLKSATTAIRFGQTPARW